MPGRTPAWIRTATPHSNPAQTDRSRQVLPYDPRKHDPFLMLAEDWFSRTGFDWHPHRGFETVTFVLEGELEHRDNAGGHGVLGPGDVQWTTTGSGVLHTEVAHRRQGVHTLQLWLNLPSRLKMRPPRYQDLRGRDAPAVRGELAEARLFSGRLAGVQGPAENLWPCIVADVRVQAGGRLDLDVPDDHVAFAYVVEGSLTAGGVPVEDGQAAWFDAGQAPLHLASSTGGRAILYASAPIGEPVAAYGPFVMTTRDELLEAIEDYQAGRFGTIPRPASG